MPHVTRDPETGQFTTMDHGPERYNDYEQLHISSQYTVNAGDLPGAFPITETDINVVEFSDLLDRDERADLVMIQVHSIQASVPGTSSAESALKAGFELSLGPGSEMLETSDSSTETQGVVDARYWDSDSPDVLYFANWVAEGGFADSTNGLGGGPDAPIQNDDVHFVKDFGTCPSLDDRDEITESIRLADVGGADISDSLIQVQVSYSLVFNVHER